MDSTESATPGASRPLFVNKKLELAPNRIQRKDSRNNETHDLIFYIVINFDIIIF